MLSAIIWLGGMLFIAIVMVPTLRKFEPQEYGTKILSSSGLRFRTVSWIAILILLLTGMLNAINRGVTVHSISTGSLFLSHFGKILILKVVLVVLMLVLSAIHDFFLGPKLAQLIDSGESIPTLPSRIKKYRRFVSWIARINAFLGLLVLACAVMLS